MTPPVTPPAAPPPTATRQPERPQGEWSADPAGSEAVTSAPPPGYEPRPWQRSRPGGGGWRPRERGPGGTPGGPPPAPPPPQPDARNFADSRPAPPERPAAHEHPPPENRPPTHDDGPPRAPAAGPPAVGVPASGTGNNTVVEGQVRGIQLRSEYRGESQSEVIWTFRVERYDNRGNRVLLVPVEMRGLTFEGSISDGDWVRTRGKMRSGTLCVDQLENLTTGASVRSKRVPKWVMVIAIVLFVAIAAWIAWGAYTIFTADTGPPPGFPEDS